MLEIRLLGQFNLQQDGRGIEIPSRPAGLLLAYLLLTRGTYHPRERLAGLLWPNSSESRARKNLRQALWQLRKAIGDSHLLVDAKSIAFNATSDFWLDIGLLENTADQDLETAVSVYEGELLPGYYEDWILLERDRLDAAFDRKMHRLLMQLLQEQRWSDVLYWAERWIAQGYIPEAAYRALMMAHASAGEPSKVVTAYQRCVEALRQEVGVDPSEETENLYKSLLSGEKISVYPFSDRPGQPVSVAAQQVNLPAQPTKFIGRKDEIAEIEHLLSNTRLLTLTGPGGIGKTRLALKVAANSLDQFSYGVHFVSLASIRSLDYMVQTVADALEFPLSTAEDPEDQLLGYLRNKRLLLLMDNFEHLLEGGVVVSKILQAASGVKILATSREKLGLQGEATISIGGMGFPDMEIPDGAQAHDSIELFAQSASRARSGFELSAGDLERAAHICQIVQGMPLAIELATAWLDTLSLEEIEGELEQGLSILSTEMRDVPDRHRNIRAVFDHSWSLIDPAEREVFMSLSVFRNGFTREAAQQVAGASLELIAGLVRKSFVRHDPSASRFEIHELMRQYAQEKLEETPQAITAAREAHAAYFASFMHMRWDHLKDGRQLLALNEIETDIENVRAAWRYRVSLRDASQIRLFINSIYRVYFFRGWNYAAVELFGEAAEALRELTDDEEAKAVGALAQANQALFMAWLGLSERGFELARESLEILEQLNRPKELVFALDSVGLNAFYLGRQAEHEQAVHRTFKIATEIDDKWRIAYALFLLSMEALWKHEFAEAWQHAESSLKISEEHDDWVGITWALLVLGHAVSAQGEYAKARKHYLRCRGVSEDIGFRWGIEKSNKYLGQVALAMNETAEAESYFLQSLSVAEEIGLGRDRIDLIFEFAKLQAAEGNPESAVELLALVVKHPASRLVRLGEEPIRDSAQSLIDNLEGGLAHITFVAAFERGQALELEDVVAGLIEANSSSL
ncbi:MAG: BTAD domain-containing putative transcriptional regulator, partial [Anaerolineales bacterium]